MNYALNFAVDGKRSAITAVFSLLLLGALGAGPAVTKHRADPAKKEFLANLESMIQGPFAHYNPNLTQTAQAPMEKDVLEVQLVGHAGSEAYFCFCVNRVNPRHAAYNEHESFEINAQNNQFGCFLAKKEKPSGVITLSFFPTQRWMDYRAECTHVLTANAIVVDAFGESYGDQPHRRVYKVDPDNGSVKEQSPTAYPGIPPMSTPTIDPND